MRGICAEVASYSPSTYNFPAQYLFFLVLLSGLLFETDVGGDGVGEFKWSVQIQLALDLYLPMSLYFSLALLSTWHPAV